MAYKLVMRGPLNRGPPDSTSVRTVGEEDSGASAGRAAGARH